MAIDSFASLKSSIAAWAVRTDFTAVIPDFITLAESLFNNGDAKMEVEPLRLREMETAATSTPSSGDITLATDFLEMRRVTLQSNPKRVLEYAPPDWLDGAYTTTTSGDPSFYTIVGSTLSIRPTSTSSLQYLYYAKIPALSDSNTTNWLLTKSPNAYLFGSLYFLEIYARNPEGAVAMGTLLGHALAGLTGSDTMSRAGSYAMRSAVPAF